MDLTDRPKDPIIDAYEELDRLLEDEMRREAGCEAAYPGCLIVGTCAMGLAQRRLLEAK